MVLLNCRESYKLAESENTMNKEQAQELADNFRSIYATPDNAIKVNLPRFTEASMEECYYVSVWLGNELIACLNSYQQLDAWRKFAAILVQTDEDIRQEENFSLLVDGPPDNGQTDLPENMLSSVALSEGWHL